MPVEVMLVVQHRRWTGDGWNEATGLSPPFVKRLIGTIRREYLDRIFFWNAQDLERKLVDFRQ